MPKFCFGLWGNATSSEKKKANVLKKRSSPSLRALLETSKKKAVRFELEQRKKRRESQIRHFKFKFSDLFQINLFLC